jgi:hypothetical protein
MLKKKSQPHHQQQQQDAEVLQQHQQQRQAWQQLQAECYGLLNQLVECSCVGTEQQLLVVPMALGELLQDRLAEGGVLTGKG